MKTWAERIQDAKERGKFTELEIRMASSWAQCAVSELGFEHNTAEGSQCVWAEDEEGKIVGTFDSAYCPTMVEGMGRLNMLGGAFYTAVRENDFSKAEELHAQIQEFRVA